MAAKIQSVVQAWKIFDLPGLQTELEITATQLAERQDEGDNSRKKLVELSREFKRNTPEDIRKAVAPLLKSFQSEVDNLSKRSKSSEASLFSLYKKLVDVSDPVPVLELAQAQQQKLNKLHDLEIENKQLRETLAEYNEEFKDVRNQEVTIKQLKEKIRHYEEEQKEFIQKRMDEAEKDISRQFLEREREIQEQQLLVAKKLGEAEQRVVSLEGALHQAQSELFNARTKLEEGAHAKSDELEMVLSDLERANQRATLAEKEVSALKDQLLSANQSVQMSDKVEQTIDMLSRSSALEMELSAKEKEIAQLVEDVQRYQQAINKCKETSSFRISQLEEEIAQKSNLIEKLEMKLEAQRDYEEVKRELSILKSIEFPNIGPTPEGTNKPLEVLLLEKTKSLQADNTNLKLSSAEMQERHSNLLQEHDVLMRTTGEQKELILQLEKDLSNIQSLSIIYRGEGEGQPSSSEFLEEAVRETTTTTTTTSSTPLPGTSPPPPSTTDMETSLLPIVSAQRERFKQRNQELESVMIQQQQQITLLQSEVDTMRTDNVKLYEKIRYLQSYSGQSLQVDTRMENRYLSEYEEKLDPFSSFSRRERQRRYAQLSPFEKITLSLGRFIFSNKTARTFTVIYTLLLHSLVFLVLYKLAYTESCHRTVSSDCAQKFAEHMQSVHGEAVEFRDFD